MINPRFQIAAVCAALVFGAASLHAQATRTWVSGVGDDVNPCSRTAPCKTFAGAISKTAEGGEIDPLDPAGYGAVTITKAITLDGGTGSGWASILATGTANAINVNLTTGTHVNDGVVILRNITINGTFQAPTAGGVLTNGINYIKAAQLIVENCVFEDLLGTGINESSMATTSVLRVNGSSFTSPGTGILVNTSSGFAAAQIDNCHFNGGATGVNTTSNAFVTISNSTFAQTTSANGAVRSNTGCQVNVSNSTLASNVFAVKVDGGPVRISNNDFFNNSNGIGGSGAAESANNNRFRGNTTDGPVVNIIAVK